MGEPVFLSLLTADKVIEEKITNKRSIIGTFTNFHAGQFPATFPPWFIYASATNLVGKHNSSINITMDSSNLVVFSAGGTPQIENVNSVVQIAIPVRGTRFPEQGKYTVAFYVDNRQVGSRVLNVLAIDKSGGEA